MKDKENIDCNCKTYPSLILKSAKIKSNVWFYCLFRMISKFYVGYLSALISPGVMNLLFNNAALTLLLPYPLEWVNHFEKVIENRFNSTTIIVTLYKHLMVLLP